MEMKNLILRLLLRSRQVIYNMMILLFVSVLLAMLIGNPPGLFNIDIEAGPMLNVYKVPLLFGVFLAMELSHLLCRRSIKDLVCRRIADVSGSALAAAVLLRVPGAGTPSDVLCMLFAVAFLFSYFFVLFAGPYAITHPTSRLNPVVRPLCNSLLSTGITINVLLVFWLIFS